MQWNLNGVPDGLSIYQIFYNFEKKKIRFLSSTLSSYTVDLKINFVKIIYNRFEESRINGHLKLINGNGKLTVTISNVQYNESGVFSFDFTSTDDLDKKGNANFVLDVQGTIFSQIVFF